MRPGLSKAQILIYSKAQLFGWRDPTHLVNKGGEFVVESLDLLLLLLPHPLKQGIDLQVEGCQEALVDGHFLDAPRSTHHPTSHAIATAGTSYSAPETQPIASTPKAGPAGAISPTDRDSLAASQVVEAPGAKATPEALPGLAHGGGGEAGPAARHEAS